MANEVVWYHSEEAGSPTLNNAAGSLINVLDACLINGFNSKSVTSIVVASNVATATISAHGYETGKIVEFAGATPSGLNGRQKVTVTSSNTVTFPTTGVSDQTATGTITAKRPGLGWTKAYSATNKAIYARSDVTASAMLLRIDDTATSPATATYARAVMVESATGIDTFTNKTPTDTQLAGGYYWGKGVNNSTAKKWILVGDGLTFYLLTDNDNYPFAANGGLHFHFFGDFAPLRSADAYPCVISGDYTTNGATHAHNAQVLTANPNEYAMYAARSFNAIDFAPALCLVGRVNGHLGSSTNPAYPSPIDNGMVIEGSVPVAERSTTFNHPIRGYMRGLLAPQANIVGRLHGQVLTDVDGFSGELLAAGTLGQGQPGCVMFDITNAWS